MDTKEEDHRIQAFVDRGNYHAALNITLSSLNACRKKNNLAGIDHFIETLKSVVQTLAEEARAEAGNAQQPEE